GLHRWAHRRLPAWARSAVDTADLVQDAILHTLRKADALNFSGRDTLAADLRTAVSNHIRDEHRPRAPRGPHEALSDGLVDPASSPHDHALSAEVDARYRAALTRMRPADRELIVAHLELDYTHDQLACMTGRSRNAARMALRRAIERLVRQMSD